MQLWSHISKPSERSEDKAERTAAFRGQAEARGAIKNTEGTAWRDSYITDKKKQEHHKKC